MMTMYMYVYAIRQRYVSRTLIAPDDQEWLEVYKGLGWECIPLAVETYGTILARSAGLL